MCKNSVEPEKISIKGSLTIFNLLPLKDIYIKLKKNTNQREKDPPEQQEE
jgi:hypothetical protein